MVGPAQRRRHVQSQEPGLVDVPVSSIRGLGDDRHPAQRQSRRTNAGGTAVLDSLLMVGNQMMVYHEMVVHYEVRVNVHIFR
jgi:hypothetical protein